MKIKSIRKTIFWTLGIIIGVVAVLILFISPLTKYMVEKYDEKLLGREVEMDLAYVNPFTGYMYFKNVKIYEANSDSIFFRSKGISANFSVYKVLNSTYEITELKINEPVIFFKQRDSLMNLDDIIQRFSSKDTTPKKQTEKTRFSINSIIIDNGEFHYHEEVLPVNYFIKKVNIESTGFRWDSDTMAAKYDFVSGNDKGEIKGNFTINIDNQDYRLATVMKKYDLKFLEQYMMDFAKYGNFEANMDANIRATGNFKDAEKLDARGLIGINDFRFGKNKLDDYARFDRLVVDISELNPASHVYVFDSAILTRPYVKYERYDQLDNFTNMFNASGGNIQASASTRFNLILEIAEYVTDLSRNFFKSNYKVDRIAVVDADFRYNDFALNEKFSVDANPFNLFADSIAKYKDRVKISLRSGIKPFGNFSLFVSINPKDSSDFDMTYKIDKLPTSMFNPYLITYTSFPMDRGTIELSGTWHVKNGRIHSNNHLLVVDPRLGNRIKKKDASRLPLPLIMYFVRERANVIDYEIPITGNLSHPKFHLRDIIFDILSNIFVKPPTTPYRIKVKQVEKEIEKYLTFKWDMRQVTILNQEQKFVERMADFLEGNKDAMIHVRPRVYEIKEKEYILFYEAKKKFFMATNEITEAEYTMEDSIKVEKMAIRDSSFIRYLNRHANGKILYTVQDKCMALVGAAKVNAAYTQLLKKRQESFLKYFVSRNLQKQIKFQDGESRIPYNGYSFYRIEYKGELPYNLYKAYTEMNDLDNSPPRRRFKKERRRRYQLAPQVNP
jgi:hypothetical protein